MLILNIAFYVSLALGVITLFIYLSHPLAGTYAIKYAGGKFWLAAFIILLVKAFKA